jgi:hypothetical protein
MVLLALCREPGVRLGAPETRLADHDFACSAQNSAFWRLWADGRIDPLVALADAQACLRDGPASNRGWARGRLIQQFHDAISDVDWGFVELRHGADRWARRLRVELPRTDSLNRAELAPLLAQVASVADLAAVLGDQAIPLARERYPIDDVRALLAIPEAGSVDHVSGDQPRSGGNDGPADPTHRI